MHRQYEIEETGDGSCTIYNAQIEEHFHSAFGARAESRHIFIDNAFAKVAKEKVSVLEIGFGTGLNVLLTFLYFCTDKTVKEVDFHTYELYPLSDEVTDAYIKALPNNAERAVMRRLHDAPWDTTVEVFPGFFLTKHRQDARTIEGEYTADAIYMDAFSPEKCPELWEPDMLRTLYRACKHGGYLSTYCAKGYVRRTLASLGFETYRTAGPPGGKREILVCRKP